MGIHISPGNTKIGNVPSFSFPPHVTCATDVPCRKQCYAWRLSRTRPTVQAAWQRNLTLWQNSPIGLELQINRYLDEKRPPLFRWFVSGDFPDKKFALLVRDLAVVHHYTRFMAYTKRWREWGAICNTPDNLTIRFSRWPAYGWASSPEPWTEIIPRGSDPMPGSWLCPGDCKTCGYKCWDHDVNVSIRFH
jgi:hypothetical protein